MIRVLCVFMMLWISSNVSAITLPQQAAIPGGVVIIPVAPDTSAKPIVRYNKKPVMVIKKDDQWLAVVGISLSAKVGEQLLSVSIDGKKSKARFAIKDKAYPTQHIEIKNKRKVNPNKLDMTRINSESAKISSALEHWSEGQVNSNFIWPIEGRVSGLFGRRRVFNGQPRRPHSGMDIAAPTGTSIMAPEAGVVRNPGDYFFNGNTVFIDHGQGLVTMFCHMDRVDVKNGQVVQQGDVIGTVGMTGRVTGPHLHLGVSLNDERVEPRLFFPERQAVAGDEKD